MKQFQLELSYSKWQIVSKGQMSKQFHSFCKLMSFVISNFDIVEEMASFGVLNTFGVSKGMWYSVLDLGHTMGLKPFWI